MIEKIFVASQGSSPSDPPYSPAVICQDMIFVSGQVGINPDTSTLISDDFAEQVDQVFVNMKSVLGMAGSGIENVVKTTAFLTDMNNFSLLNEAYKRWFPNDRPARSCIQVSGLPVGAIIEIEAIAFRK